MSERVYSCGTRPARRIVCAIAATWLFAAPAAAQIGIRLQILQAEERRSPTSADIALLRQQARTRSDNARAAVRAMGHIARLSLAPSLQAALVHSLPDVRAEAASALASTLTLATATSANVAADALRSAQSALIARLKTEAEPDVRAALCEAIGRLPYVQSADVERAVTAILGSGAPAPTRMDRLGQAEGLEALIRLRRGIARPSADALTRLRELARPPVGLSPADHGREARVRRLSMEALTTAGAIDAVTVGAASEDSDAQVRRLAMRAASDTIDAPDVIARGLDDPSAGVRVEALRALRARASDEGCAQSLRHTSDSDVTVALVAIDQLAACAQSPAALTRLEALARDTSGLTHPRGWHRFAHALVALATAAPIRVAPLLAPAASSSVMHVRLYAARAAALAHDRDTLTRLVDDDSEAVANTARSGLDMAPRPAAPRSTPAEPSITVAEMRSLTGARARIVVRDVGTLDVALLAAEAPGTVVRFARLVDAGYYNGVTVDRVAPNAVAQTGDRPGWPGARLPASETSPWPHVRGTLAAAAPDTGDAQFFINLVDNPRLDRRYGVFGQILAGLETIDQLLEGDIIESVVIVP